MSDDSLSPALPAELARALDRTPARLLVDTRVDDRMPGGSMLDWLTREPRFAATMAGYVEVSRTGFLRVFHRRPGAVPACVAGDRRAVGG